MNMQQALRTVISPGSYKLTELDAEVAKATWEAFNAVEARSARFVRELPRDSDASQGKLGSQ